MSLIERSFPYTLIYQWLLGIDSLTLLIRKRLGKRNKNNRIESVSLLLYSPPPSPPPSLSLCRMVLSILKSLFVASQLFFTALSRRNVVSYLTCLILPVTKASVVKSSTLSSLQ